MADDIQAENAAISAIEGVMYPPEVIAGVSSAIANAKETHFFGPHANVDYDLDGPMGRGAYMGHMQNQANIETMSAELDLMQKTNQGF